ncbi:MAG TPA: MaoC family dehydratase [Dehalococcoidia bacterium]|nr:MaoC family dehydratase [Dehalococcoidia bacterium]
MPEVGARASRELVVTPELVRAYAEITGDYNPLHFDEEFVAATRFGRLMAQGGIATGLLHALVAMDLPGPGSVFSRQRWSFPRPVYIGDTIRAEGTILSANTRRRFYEMAFIVTNQAEETVLEGEATVYQAERRSNAEV